MKVRCQYCDGEVELAACEGANCSNRFVAKGDKRLCASCFFAGSNLPKQEMINRRQQETVHEACGTELMAKGMP